MTLRRRRRSRCPVSTALDIFGDRWSLLIVRDLLFTGRRTFKEFSGAAEGIATNVLAERLARLEAEGIVTGVRDPDDARRVSYSLTRKGMALAPVLVEMVIWAARHEKTGVPPAVVKHMSRGRAAFIRQLPMSVL